VDHDHAQKETSLIMRVCVIDGRGGGLGSRLVGGLQTELDQAHHIVGLGTNSAAAAAMKQAGAMQVGVGPRAIADMMPTVDVIVASLNLVLPGSMLGEVTPEIVRAILGARAKKVLLPVNRAQIEIMGIEGRTLESLIDQAILRVCALLHTSSLV
jgi:hypothetical protein